MANTITEAKAELSALVDRAAEGAEIIISKAGKAVAVHLPYTRATSTRQPGRLRVALSSPQGCTKNPWSLSANMILC